jgi:hypothetical protein
MENGHEIINMLTVTNMLECTTHPLEFPEQDEKWTWNHQYIHGHEQARRHDSPTMISKAGHRMDMQLA